MAYYYDSYVENYGKRPNHYWSKGTYIMPDGKIFDVDNYAKIAHAGGFVIPFFQSYMNPDKKYIYLNSKEEVLEGLLDWQHVLQTREYDVNPKEQKMRINLVQYFIKIYKSRYAIWNQNEGYADFSKVTGIPNVEENWCGRDCILKDVLVQACDYDAIESQLYKTITTSKFNPNETFYDYIIHDWKIVQIPKKLYDEKLEQFIDYQLPDWMIPDKELRLQAELESICRNIPLEKRSKLSRSKVKINRYDFID